MADETPKMESEVKITLVLADGTLEAHVISSSSGSWPVSPSDEATPDEVTTPWPAATGGISGTHVDTAATEMNTIYRTPGRFTVLTVKNTERLDIDLFIEAMTTPPYQSFHTQTQQPFCLSRSRICQVSSNISINIHALKLTVGILLTAAREFHRGGSRFEQTQVRDDVRERSDGSLRV